MAADPPTSQPAIAVRGVSKTFTSGPEPVTALADVSFDIGTGGTTVLIGPSGCGKSTLLNMFAELESPSHGDIAVAGAAGRQAVGMMFQKSSLQPWRSVVQNVMLPAEILKLDRAAARRRAEELLDMVGLARWRDRYPHELSGGMQQRVALARVLLPDPDILLLDEPFGALDEMTREGLDVEMCRIVEGTGKTIVMVTHSIYEAVLVADTIAVFSPHPGTLQTLINVPLAHPRDISMTGLDTFAHLVAEVRGALRGDETREASWARSR
jgi:NitT/TauT family transport system ATP-binding protein